MCNVHILKGGSGPGGVQEARPARAAAKEHPLPAMAVRGNIRGACAVVVVSVDVTVLRFKRREISLEDGGSFGSGMVFIFFFRILFYLFFCVSRIFFCNRNTE